MKFLAQSTIDTGLHFKPFFSSLTKSSQGFTRHIYASIPSYAEMEAKTADSIINIYPDGALVLDIGASEGAWGKRISHLSKGRIITHNLDPNPDMYRTFIRNPVKNAIFLLKSYDRGFLDGDSYIQGYAPNDIYDVIRESMTFQFLSPNRKEQYASVKKALKKDGLFITNSKVFLENQAEYLLYEKLKDMYKREFFSEKEIKHKSQHILKSMSKNMTTLEKTVYSLQSLFQHVVQYWVSGNFHGFIATDNKHLSDTMLSFLPTQWPYAVQGKILS